jgi:glucuronosyltransferase
MSRLLRVFLCSMFFINKVNGARILSVYPIPSISHQVVFRALTLELVKRGHELVVITPDPMYRKGKSPPNLTEIDVHNISYELWYKGFIESRLTKGKKDDFLKQMKTMAKVVIEVFEKQILNDEVQQILKNKTRKFDLLLCEASVLPALAFSYLLNIPVIQVSSLGTTPDMLKALGAPVHVFLYPSLLQQRIFNHTNWEYVIELYKYNREIETLITDYGTSTNKFLKRTFGSNVPDVNELKKEVTMLFTNVHPFWELNRPVPIQVVYLGGLHQQPERSLPKVIVICLCVKNCFFLIVE